jgi:hypothetical protein
MDFQADGGGDGPESVNQALYEAVHRLSWSQDPKTYRVVFLVGDAPPHMDYQGEVKYPDTLAAAQQKGIVVNAIQCGALEPTAREWQRIAQLGKGSFFEVEQGGGAVAIATPFDADLAELSAKLDKTRLYYGTAKDKAKQQRKLAATEKLHASSSVESRARRAAFNASESGKGNLLGKQELVDDVASGRVKLSTLPAATLPESLQPLTPAEREAAVQQSAEQRSTLKKEIQALSARRAEYLKRKVEAAGGAEDSLDHKVYGAVRKQAAAAGLRYEAPAPAY